MDVLQVTPEIQVSHIGPPLDAGQLPSVFYFALSARESLDLDPYNQPALYLASHGIRLFSFDLPAHGTDLSAIDAIGVWATDFARGKDPITPFVQEVLHAIEHLISRRLIIREKIGIMGLSRGGLIGSLVAAHYQNVRASVHFAPLTELSMAKEFENLRDNPEVIGLNLKNHLQALCTQTIRFYIGNRDIRVGTDRCFSLVEELANTAYENNLRSPPIEMVVGPSIGHMGHGTAKETFEAGAEWLGRKLGAIR